MSTWWKLIQLELDEIKNFTEPTGDVQPKETIIGEATEEIKKLYTMWQSVEKSAALEMLKYRYDGLVTDEQKGKIIELKARASIVESLFWLAVNEEYNLWPHDATSGIRKGWHVVEFERPKLNIRGIGGINIDPEDFGG